MWSDHHSEDRCGTIFSKYYPEVTRFCGRRRTVASRNVEEPALCLQRARSGPTQISTELSLEKDIVIRHRSLVPRR